MDWITIIFGHGKDLNYLQMSSRAVIIFIVTLLFLRIAGVRTFGKKSAFDNVIIIMLGSILSRAVVGASAFFPTVIASLAFVLVHRILGALSYHSELVGRLIKGEKASLWLDGKLNRSNMKRSQVSEKDLLESIRLKTGADGFDQVKEIYVERNGELSIIKK